MLERIHFGDLPTKHHTRLKGKDGQLRWEECITCHGFDGAYSILYHQYRPHEQRAHPSKYGWVTGAEQNIDYPLQKRHFRTQTLKEKKGFSLNCRQNLLENKDIRILVLFPDSEDPVYFNNADSDELFFIQRGGGTLRSPLGDLIFHEKEYVYIPKGILHRFIPHDNQEQFWLNIQCHQGLHIPKQWRNTIGQLRMDAPYCHRDFRHPQFKGPTDEGIREIVVKRGNRFHGFSCRNSPLDVVGWDGTIYPWAFSIYDFQARVGLVHLPPSWHGSFATPGALICSFVPRPVDFHSEALPCPYPHSSVDCDEVLFYCQGDFSSRNGVAEGSISLHPMGIAHGPHPGAYASSHGSRRTEELAVMIDCFSPLQTSVLCNEIEDFDYEKSFVA